MLVLKKRRDFVRLNKHAIRVHHRGYILQILPSDVSVASPRFGFTVTKRIGNAVVRNRAKRRLRAMCHQILQQKDWFAQMQGYDFVLIAKPETPTLCFQSLLQSLRASLNKGLRKILSETTTHKARLYPNQQSGK